MSKMTSSFFRYVLGIVLLLSLSGCFVPGAPYGDSFKMRSSDLLTYPEESFSLRVFSTQVKKHYFFYSSKPFDSILIYSKPIGVKKKSYLKLNFDSVSVFHKSGYTYSNYLRIGDTRYYKNFKNQPVRVSAFLKDTILEFTFDPVSLNRLAEKFGEK